MWETFVDFDIFHSNYVIAKIILRNLDQLLKVKPFNFNISE